MKRRRSACSATPRGARAAQAACRGRSEGSTEPGDVRARRTLTLGGCLASVGLVLTGCAAQRELVIVSEPPGALVRLDDTVVGTTPYSTSFDAYGTRRVTLYLDGYRTKTHVFELDPPWYARFPIDVFSEVLLPFGWHDRHEVPLTLERESGAVTPPDLEAVLDRAQALRYAEPTGPLVPKLKPKPDASSAAPTSPDADAPVAAPHAESEGSPKPPEPRETPRPDGG